MNTDTLTKFQESLDRLGVDWSVFPASEFQKVLPEHLLPPAVGAPLVLDGCSLDGLPVETRPTPDQLESARTGVTGARLGIADYGSILIPSTPRGDEIMSLFPHRHVAVLGTSDLVPDMRAAFAWMGGEFRAGNNNAVIATGPSATADMGKLVKGAHGPAEVTVLLIEDR